MTTPNKAKVKLSRIVTEIAVVHLDRDGSLREIIDICDELDSEDERVLSIIDVLTVHDDIHGTTHQAATV